MNNNFTKASITHFPVAIYRFIQQNRGFIAFLLLMFAFRSSFADWNTVPTGSMKPTIVEGDRIFVNKMAYDLRIPFTHISLLRLGEPQRGDIIVFDSAVSEIRLVKRVVAVPGDTLAIVNNQLILNGEPLAYHLVRDGSIAQVQEVSGPQQYTVQFDHSLDSEYAANMDVIPIPEGYYFAMGDNRNNSRDSRFIGLVPRTEIVGRTRSVVMSLNYDNYYLPRSERFFRDL